MSEENPDDDADDTIAAAVEPLLLELEPRLANALRMRIGSGAGSSAAAADGRGMSTSEVAAALGVSRQRAEQLLAQAVKELRLRVEAAAGFCPELGVLLETLSSSASGGASGSQ